MGSKAAAVGNAVPHRRIAHMSLAAPSPAPVHHEAFSQLFHTSACLTATFRRSRINSFARSARQAVTRSQLFSSIDNIFYRSCGELGGTLCHCDPSAD